MIWFACKKCSKRHGRAEGLSGTMVFCECGFGNRVPWSSTVAEPPPEESPVPLPLPSSSGRPRPSTPIPFRDDDDEPRRGWSDEPRRPRSDDPLPPPFRPKPRKENRRVNPKFCLNHDELPTEHTCAQCRLPFCSKCVLELQGEMLCGPCKNFKVRGMQRPTRISPLSTMAAVGALVAGPISFCLTTMGIGTQAQGVGGAGALLFGLIGLLLPAGTLVLSLWALKEIESKPRMGGRALAMTGTAGGLLGVMWCVTVLMVMVFKFVER